MKNIFLLSFFGLFTLGQLQRIEINSQIAFYLHDILIVFYLAFNAKTIKKIVEKVKKIKKIDKKILLILIINVFLAYLWSFINGSFKVTALLYLARFSAYFCFISALKQNYGTRKIKHYFTLAAAVILGLGFLQYFLLPDLRWLYYLGWDDHFYRLTSTLFDPAFTGLIFVFHLVHCLEAKQRKLHYLCLDFLFLLGLALTYSRASYLSFLSVLVVSSILDFKAHWKKTLISLVIFSVMIFALPKQIGGEGVNLTRTSTITARIENIKDFSQQLNGPELIFGQGVLIPYYESHQEGLTDHARFPDSWPILIFNGFGVIGGLCIVYFLTKEIFKLWKKKQLKKLALLLALLVHGLFNQNLTESFVMLSFWGFYL